MSKQVELLISDYGHFSRNAKDFNLKKSYAVIAGEVYRFERLHHVEGVENKEDGLYLDGKNIFPGATLTCVVDLDTN